MKQFFLATCNTTAFHFVITRFLYHFGSPQNNYNACHISNLYVMCKIVQKPAIHTHTHIYISLYDRFLARQQYFFGYILKNNDVFAKRWKPLRQDL